MKLLNLSGLVRTLWSGSEAMGVAPQALPGQSLRS